MRNRRRRGYKFTEKKHSRQGILATVLALALLVWYLVFLKLAFQGEAVRCLLIMGAQESLR